MIKEITVHKKENFPNTCMDCKYNVKGICTIVDRKANVKSKRNDCIIKLKEM